jgi:hypothetical protein
MAEGNPVRPLGVFVDRQERQAKCKPVGQGTMGAHSLTGYVFVAKTDHGRTVAGNGVLETTYWFSFNCDGRRLP